MDANAMNNQGDDRFLTLILLPIALAAGIVCCVWPQFFVKRPGLRLGLLFRLIPEQHQSTVIRVLGVIAIFASAVGLIHLLAPPQ
jgi:hypothetical protein